MMEGCWSVGHRELHCGAIPTDITNIANGVAPANYRETPCGRRYEDCFCR